MVRPNGNNNKLLILYREETTHLYDKYPDPLRSSTISIKFLSKGNVEDSEEIDQKKYATSI